MNIFGNHLNELIVDTGVMREKSKSCKWGGEKKRFWISEALQVVRAAVYKNW